jgi:hypothetical protein
MYEVRTQIPAADLTPGQFFLVNDRWYRAAGALIQRDDAHAPQLRVVSPVTGETASIWLHAERVTVTEGNTVPATFQRASLMRRVRIARQKAAEQEKIASQLEALADTLDRVDTDA